jgi:hypothetical protein
MAGIAGLDDLASLSIDVPVQTKGLGPSERLRTEYGAVHP